jgi:hypothetical protein
LLTQKIEKRRKNRWPLVDLNGAETETPNLASSSQKYFLKNCDTTSSDGDFGKYFHLPVSVNFGKWILFTGKLPVNKKIN